MRGSLALALVALVGAQAYVRLSPSDPGFHIDLVAARPAAMVPDPSRSVVTLSDGAFVDLETPDPAATLARLAEVAAATPRTRVFAGSVGEGHITWETRSLFWGFPDYTTAQITPAGVTLYARLRFGRGDLGVNGRRLEAWRTALRA